MRKTDDTNDGDGKMYIFYSSYSSVRWRGCGTSCMRVCRCGCETLFFAGEFDGAGAGAVAAEVSCPKILCCYPEDEEEGE